MSAVEIQAKDVKALRERTGAGMMDCKKALTEAGGDIEQAIEILRVKQGKKVQDLGERVATEGTVQAYVHAGAKVGVLIEVDCNTDFVASNEEFVAFARDVAMQIAATPTVKYVSREDVPDELREGDLAAFEASNEAVEFEALSDTEFMLGSAVPHDHELVLGSHSVHTSRDALREAEGHISAIRGRLVQEHRL